MKGIGGMGGGMGTGKVFSPRKKGGNKPETAKPPMGGATPNIGVGMAPPKASALALPVAKPIPSMAGAPVGSPAHTAAHAGFRSKQTPVATDRGQFSFKENKSAQKPGAEAPKFGGKRAFGKGGD